MGVAATLISLMIGLLFDTLFSAIVRNVPGLIRQDAHISLPLCEIFPNLNGCEPLVGLWGGLQIAEISRGVGQIAGLIAVQLLVAVLSSYASLQVGRLGGPTGILMGITASLASLLLIWLIGLPLWPNPGLGFFSMAALAWLPVSGWLGGRYGGQKLLKRLPSPGFYSTTGRNTVAISGIEETLTDRELEVLLLLAEGLKNREIAQRLHLSTATVKTHVLHIYDKLGVRNRTAAVRQALSVGLLIYDENLSETDH